MSSTIHAYGYDNRPVTLKEWSAIALCAMMGFAAAWAYSGFAPISFGQTTELRREPTTTDAAYTVCNVLNILGTMTTAGITMSACDVIESPNAPFRSKGFGGVINAAVTMDSSADASGICRAIAGYVSDHPELFHRMHGKLWSLQIFKSPRQGQAAAICTIP